MYTTSVSTNLSTDDICVDQSLLTSVYTINNASSTASIYIGSESISTNSVTSNDSLLVHGDADFNGDLKIKGKSLSDTLESIEKRLAILHTNKELEEKWERLKSLGQMYRDLEKEILEREQVYSILKK